MDELSLDVRNDSAIRESEGRRLDPPADKPKVLNPFAPIIEED